MKEDTIIHGEKLAEIIRDELTHALMLEKVHTSQEVEYYLVTLLNDYHVVGRLPESLDQERPLAVRFIEAVSQTNPSKVDSLKNIGDGTLLMLGFFAEHISRSIVDISYYISIGGSAYETLASILVCNKHFAEIYAELASKFAMIVNVIARLAPCNRASTNSELMNIYRRWLYSGNTRLGDVLEREGLI